MASASDTLQNLLRSEEFQHLPIQFALHEGPGRWWQAIDRMAEAAARQQICVAAHWAGLLFDTYGALIETVSLHFNIEDGQFLTARLEINGDYCYSEQVGLESATLEAIGAIDEQAVFDACVSQLDDLGSSHLIPSIDLLNQAFWDPLRSAAQARELARTYAPEFDAWLQQRLLDQGLGPATSRRVSARM